MPSFETQLWTVDLARGGLSAWARVDSDQPQECRAARRLVGGYGNLLRYSTSSGGKDSILLLYRVFSQVFILAIPSELRNYVLFFTPVADP